MERIARLTQTRLRTLGHLNRAKRDRNEGDIRECQRHLRYLDDLIAEALEEVEMS